MAETTLAKFFPIAAAHRGLSYSEAKAQILALQDRERKKAQEELRKISESPTDWDSRLTALILLGWLEPKASFVQCGMFARGDLAGPPPIAGFTSKLRAQVIARLGKEVTPRVLEMLYKTHEWGDAVQEGALFGALVYLKDELAVAPLITLLREPDTSVSARVGALSVLSAMGAAPALDAVIAIAGDITGDDALRQTALRALGGFKGPRAAQFLSETVRNPARSLEDRQAAASALESFGTSEVRESVRETLRTTDDQLIRLTLISLLGRTGDKDDLEFLQKFARDSDPEVAQAARDAIGEISKE